MARLTRDNYYVDLMERVLGGVQVMTVQNNPSRSSWLDDTRRSWTRGSSTSTEEVVVAIDDRSVSPE